MKYSIPTIALSLCSALVALPTYAFDETVTQYINPFIGTGRVDGGSLAGNTYPGATAPFGLVQLSPDVEQAPYGHQGYEYERNQIFGFSHTHQSGTGACDWLDFLVMPTCRSLEELPDREDFNSPFSHEGEQAAAGYYRVHLDEFGIDAELTATTRTGMHRYTYPAGREQNLVFDLVHKSFIPYWSAHNDAKVHDAQIKRLDAQTYVGFRVVTGWSRLRKVYFCLQFSRPVKTSLLWRRLAPGTLFMGNGKHVYRDADVLNGQELRAFFQFEPQAEPLVVKVALSPVSIEGAVDNMQKENPAWDFDAVRRQTVAAWEKELANIRVEGGEEEKTIFYTGLYHAYVQPHTFFDHNGEYMRTDYSTGKLEKGQTHYTTFSLWDTFRATHPLYTILQPERNAAFVESMLRRYNTYGYLPMIEFWGTDVYCMIANHSVPVVVEAALKGLVDKERAFEAVKNTSLREHLGSPWRDWEKYGYIPTDVQWFSAAATLELAYNDACVARLAQALGKQEDYERFNRRAHFYRNLFDEKTKFFRGRNSQGDFLPGFDPFVYGPNAGDPYIEGNAWQWRFFAPQDMDDLVALYGGPAEFELRLDSLFELPIDPAYGHSMQSSGNMGQYAHGNEPAHNYIYLYHYTKHPWKVQHYVNRILHEQYNTSPAGYTGNDDMGQMSAWYIFSSLGFYPIDPTDGRYYFGSPIWREASIKLPGGRTFTVKTNRTGEDDWYVRSIRLNGKPWKLPYITHEAIMQGGTLEFVMGVRKK